MFKSLLVIAAVLMSTALVIPTVSQAAVAGCSQASYV